MENTDPYNRPYGMPEIKPEIPNAQAAYVLGIVSLCLTVTMGFCYGVGFLAGIVTGIIGIVLGHGAARTYEANPDLYDPRSYQKAKTGRLLSIISLIATAVLIVATIFIVLLFVDYVAGEYWNIFDNL
jgi:uncharacterized membrane protein YbhN (UPF0104 family)